MKTAHIVYAHPEPKSFVAAMRDTTTRTLHSAGWHVELSDLYKLDFNPVASARDFPQRSNPEYLVYALEQRQAVKTDSVPPDIRREVELVIRSDLLVLVFPIFWFSMPAIMKGWIDRVFLSDVFYGGRRLYERGEMRGKRALVVASLGGREHMFGPAAIHGELTGMLRHLLQGSLGYVGFQVVQPFFAYHVPYIDKPARRALLRKLERHLLHLDDLPQLPMPSLDEFDDVFRPKAISAA